MENATKALLIAASVLIVIVLIALGVSLLGSVGDTTDQAEKVGHQLENGIEGEADKLLGSMTNTMSFAEIKEFLKNDVHGPGSDYFEGFSAIYQDYRFRICYTNTNRKIPFSEELWNKSKVIKQMPSGYRVKWQSVDTKNKRFIFLIIDKDIYKTGDVDD